MSLLRALERYWDVENIPKHDLHREEDYYVDIQKANVIVIVITITIFTITALFIGGGML